MVLTALQKSIINLYIDFFIELKSAGVKTEQKNWTNWVLSKLFLWTVDPKQLEKEEQKTPEVSRRKEIIKVRAEINEKEMKETTVKINETKSWFF